jgi:hypothetical protein
MDLLRVSLDFSLTGNNFVHFSIHCHLRYWTFVK